MTSHARDYTAIAHKYAKDVVSGKIVAGKLMKLACKRQLDDLDRAPSKDWPYVFDEWYGDDVCDFVEKLPHVEGAWDSPTIRLEPNQVFMLNTIFGWRKPDGTRRFTTVYIETARKSGKAEHVENLIPTPLGFVRMGDLRVGELVFGSDGKPTAIVAVTEPMYDFDCAEVEFSTGEKIVVAMDHLWPVHRGDGPREVLDGRQIAEALRTTCVSSPQIGVKGHVPDYRREIIAVREVPSVPVKCIQVANADGIYMTGKSYIPTHNSSLTAGVSLYCLCCEGEVGPQIIIGATTGEQAGKVFNPAKLMVDKMTDLQDAFGLQTYARSISCAENGGMIQPINAKGKTQDGWNPHMGILDELHAHKDRSLYDVVKSAFGSRKNPLFWIITTAGFDTNGICFEQRSTAVKMLEGSITLNHLFSAIYTLDEGDDPFDERNWIKANPMIGVTPSYDMMRSASADAQVSPREEGNFKTKNLNIWMNANSAWLNVSQWNLCEDKTLDWKDFEGLDCYIGGDLADKNDMTALVLAAFDKRKRLIFKPMFWLPELVLQNPTHAEGRGPAPYRTWSKGDDPYLNLSPGDWVDHNEIEKVIRGWLKRFSVKKVTFDHFAAAQAIATKLNEDFSTPDNPIAQILHKSAKAISDSAKELEARVQSGPDRMRHDGNPIMTWMASNCTVARRRDETLLPIKESQMSPNKIDGIDALLNAIQPALLVQEKVVKPKYEMFFV